MYLWCVQDSRNTNSVSKMSDPGTETLPVLVDKACVDSATGNPDVDLARSRMKSPRKPN